MARSLITKDHLLIEINQEMASFHDCRNLRVVNVVHDPARTHGGNWMIGEFVRSGYDHADVDCHKAIVDCTTDLQERFDI